MHLQGVVAARHRALRCGRGPHAIDLLLELRQLWTLHKSCERSFKNSVRFAATAQASVSFQLPNAVNG